MTETASGFVRIAALVMLTTVFGVVWRGDQQTQQQFVVARKAAAVRESLLAERPGHREAAEQRHALAFEPTPAVSMTPESIAPAQHSRMARVEIEMELPAGIAPGTYQIVETSGRIQKVRITATQHPVSERDLYVLDPQDGQRRYFIRISDDAEMPHEHTASASTAPRQ